MGRGGRRCAGIFGSGMRAVATGASVIRNSGPKSARRREMRRVTVVRVTSSSTSRSRPESLYLDSIAWRGV
jgi:hypothetical protein